MAFYEKQTVFLLSQEVFCVSCLDGQAARGRLMTKFMSQSLEIASFCSTDTESLVLGDASSLGVTKCLGRSCDFRL